jgi:Domain of unknown function (DUF1918)
VLTVQAIVGDRLFVHGRVVGQRDRTGVIIDVRGANGGPPYLVEYDDGHQAVVYPGPDAVVEHVRREQQ